MKLTLQRIIKEDDHTTGALFIDGKYFCDTMEDKDRGLQQYMNPGEIANIKVAKETAIPYGKYKVNVTYSPTFKKNLPQIMNVPGFTGVRIHSGNYADYATFFKSIPIQTNKKLFDIEENIQVI